MNTILKRLFLVALGIVAALVVFELGAGVLLKRQKGPLSFPLGDGTRNQLTFDKELGFFPKVGEGGEYGPQGCVANDYLVDDRKGRERVLFIGDSVTHRGMIIDALRQLYGEEGFEYWNAGVDAFNPKQILELYRRHNHEVKPDHVVFTFHNNDFQLTPVAVEEEGEVVLYLPSHEPMEAPLPIIGRTALYRLWLRFRSPDYERPADEVKQDLANMQKLVTHQGARFSVVLFPILKPYDEWSKGEKRSREQALRILQEFDLQLYDPLPIMPEKADDYPALRETPDDTWHPSPKGAMLIARFLHEAGLLQSKGE